MWSGAWWPMALFLDLGSGDMEKASPLVLIDRFLPASLGMPYSGNEPS